MTHAHYSVTCGSDAATISQVSPAERDRLFESFLNAGSTAPGELANLRERALPILVALFTGEARNAFGHPYVSIGALDRGLVTAKLLGPLARPLEPYLRDALVRKHLHAAEALAALGSLEEASILELSRCVVAVETSPVDWDLAFEAATALLRAHADRHPAVEKIAAGQGRAATLMKQAAEFLHGRPT